MKNGKRLQAMAIGDLLVSICKNTSSCTIRLVTGHRTKRLWERCNKYDKQCIRCLQDWVNEEEGD